MGRRFAESVSLSFNSFDVRLGGSLLCQLFYLSIRLSDGVYVCCFG